MPLALVALDNDEIDRRELAEQLRQLRLGRPAQLVHQRPAIRRADQHLGRPGEAMAMGILARLVDVEAEMGVLDGRDPMPARDEARDHLGEERGLARAAPAGEADDAHGPS